jgi:hypothetical protein
MHLDIDEFVFPNLAAIQNEATKAKAAQLDQKYHKQILGITVGSIPVRPTTKGSKTGRTKQYTEQVRAGAAHWSMGNPECGNAHKLFEGPTTEAMKICLDHRGRRKILINGTACMLSVHHTKSFHGGKELVPAEELPKGTKPLCAISESHTRNTLNANTDDVHIRHLRGFATANITDSGGTKAADNESKEGDPLSGERGDNGPCQNKGVVLS